MDPDLNSIADLCERVVRNQIHSKTVRRYQFRNVKDLKFDSLKDSPVDSVKQPSVLPYFIQNGRYRATAVLEESVIDNECIKQTAFLRQFDPEFVDEVMACDGCVRAIVFLPNQVIVREGEKGDSMMVIAKGEVEVSMGGTPLKRLGEGSFFGELVFVGATDVRTATITAVTFCDVRLIYRAAFTTVIKKYPDVEERFKHVISGRMDVVHKEMSRHRKAQKREQAHQRQERSQRASLGNAGTGSLGVGPVHLNTTHRKLSRLQPDHGNHDDEIQILAPQPSQAQGRPAFGAQVSMRENQMHKLAQFKEGYKSTQAETFSGKLLDVSNPPWATNGKAVKDKDEGEDQTLPPLNRAQQKSPRKGGTTRSSPM